MAGNVLWLTTLDATAVTTAPVGTTTTGLGNTPDNTQITTWFDRSPVGSNTNDATQATAILQPTYFLSDGSGNVIAKIAYGNGATNSGAGAQAPTAGIAYLRHF